MTESFTTEPKTYIKRGNQTIRRNCIRFVSWIRQNGYEHELPLEQAKRLFQELYGPKDRATIKAYFGVRRGRSEKLIRRIARYPSGTISYKSIKLEQDTREKEGYFELLGLVHYEKRGLVWFLVLNDEDIVPEIAKSSARVREDVAGSNDKLSLSPYSLSSNAQQQQLVATEDREVVVDVEKRESYRMRERNRSSESILSSKEQTILAAKPSEKSD